MDISKYYDEIVKEFETDDVEIIKNTHGLYGKLVGIMGLREEGGYAGEKYMGWGKEAQRLTNYLQYL